MKIATIVERNSNTLPQELFVADWIEVNQIGIICDSLENLFLTVSFDNLKHKLNFCTKNMLKLPPNNALFEVKDIIEKYLDNHQRDVTKAVRGFPSHTNITIPAFEEEFSSFKLFFKVKNQLITTLKLFGYAFELLIYKKRRISKMIVHQDNFIVKK